MAVADALREELERQGLSEKVELKVTGCHGFCERGPLVVVYPEKVMYQRVASEDAAEIVAESVIGNNVIERLVYTDPTDKKRIPIESDIPFYRKQQRILFGSNGQVDPTRIEDYFAVEGYTALAKALDEMTRDQVVAEVKNARLRGRGGAGFLTGRKWDICRGAEPSQGATRYIVCNADEGDPGAYMDRSLLEGNPHRVIEGMLIGAYAIGSRTGYVYVRREYPLAVENLRIAIEQAREYGLLGDNILGSDLSFDLKIFTGAGAFICGEETAMIASIEGRHGSPRPRPPYPAVSGLWGEPTNVNNVETWANVPGIVSRGADWFASIGTENSKGTKIFSLVGKINNTGLVEVPMGITLREIVYDIGGGIPKGKKFKAVQTGGPSGGCMPESLLDMPVDFDRLAQAGSMMGSGGLIVMDETTCMVDVSHYFMRFLADESCGKCTPCSQGTRHLSAILERICTGKGEPEDLERLKELAWIAKNGSLCGLGMTVANPILSVLRYFPEEFEAHVREKRCPAGVCKSLISFSVDVEACRACGKCVKECPVAAISDGLKKKPALIAQEKCIRCRMCYEVCPFDAVRIA
jgi:NADH-quinone oxidoreductase subunit F